MKITKYGHSCVLAEEASARILIDPGMWSEGHTELTGLDAVCITHEHADHCHPESLEKILDKNPGVLVYTNTGAGKVLFEAGISFSLFEDGSRVEINGVSVEGFGRDHAAIYPTFPRFDNTGFFIAGRFFHPGDSVSVIPPSPVEILAIPIVAPWARIADPIDYMKQLKPRVAFIIHDGFLKFMGPYENVPRKALEGTGVDFRVPENGVTMEF